MSDRVVSTTDSIATATPEDGKLTIKQLVEKLGKTRQAIEAARDNGTLANIGYFASRVGRNWFYYPETTQDTLT